jgi:hypothetical protein
VARRHPKRRGRISSPSTLLTAAPALPPGLTPYSIEGGRAAALRKRLDDYTLEAFAANKLLLMADARAMPIGHIACQLRPELLAHVVPQGTEQPSEQLARQVLAVAGARMK